MEDEERLNDFVPDSVVIKYLLKEKEEWQKEKKDLEVQLGKEKAYIQELEYKLELEKQQFSKIKKMQTDMQCQVLASHQWKSVAGELQALREQNKLLRNTRDSLLQQLNKLKRA